MWKRNVCLFAVFTVTCAISRDAALAEPQARRVIDATALVQRVIPLPKEISIKEQVTLPVGDVRIALAPGAGPLEQNAVRKLRSLFLENSGLDAGQGKVFEILIGVCKDGRLGDVAVPDAQRLAKLPNSQQAYLIRPVGANRLVLTALDARGVFYAAITLRQLLETGFRGGEVTVPLAVVTDWPDMAERGEWGTSSSRDIEWLAERKMNLVEFHTTHAVAKDGKVQTEISTSLLGRGLINAMNMVPIISHLNGMDHRGVYDAYPDLKGKGAKAVYKGEEGSLTAPCASNPKLHEIMAEWMRGYARYGVRDISCWLGELHLRCECDQCAQVGQFALETRAFVKAWQIARQQFPDLKIRILTTQGSYDSNDKVLAEVPREVGVTYYDGGRTYDSSRNPMIYPLLENYAAKGGWLGVYPQLTPSWRIVSPWSCPQFIKARMTEFVDKKVVSLGGYVVPDNLLYTFNVTAAAEWSWNAHGRDERGFALAWAVREGFANPQMVADWAVTLGPVSWDLYGARLVERYFFRPKSIQRMVAARKPVSFGQGLFTYIPDQAHLDRNLRICENAMHLARQAGSSAMVAESEAILAYYQMLASLCRMCAALSDRAEIDSARRNALQQEMNRFAIAGALNADALRNWERAVRVGAGQGRFLESVQATTDTVDAVAAALAPWGIRNPTPCFGRQKIGQWDSPDFADQAAITKSFDVTQAIIAPGTYEVIFQYTSGWNGLAIQQVALTAQTKAGEGSPVEMAVDRHAGSTGARSTGNVYSLTLEKYSPETRYQIVAQVRGTRPQDQKPGHTGCSGEVYMQRQRDVDWQLQIMSVQPTTPAKQSRH